ncbi:MAG: hypothetical protein P8O08_06495, partial [Paracoccaceae bacterium]|nr:hypothetical protein [Paracoccaceae bacterium]
VALEALRGDKRVQVIEGMAVGFDPATLDLMHEIDRIFTKYPFLEATISRRIYLNQGSLPGDAACAT